MNELKRKANREVFIVPLITQIVGIFLHGLVLSLLRVDEGSLLWSLTFLMVIFTVHHYSDRMYVYSTSTTMKMLTLKEFEDAMIFGRAVNMTMWIILVLFNFPYGLLRKMILSIAIYAAIIFLYSLMSEYEIDKGSKSVKKPKDVKEPPVEDDYEEVTESPFINIDEDLEELKDGGFEVKDDIDFRPLGTPLADEKKKVILPDESVLEEIDDYVIREEFDAEGMLNQLSDNNEEIDDEPTEGEVDEPAEDEIDLSDEFESVDEAINNVLDEFEQNDMSVIDEEFEEFDKELEPIISDEIDNSNEEIEEHVEEKYDEIEEYEDEEDEHEEENGKITIDEILNS